MGTVQGFLSLDVSSLAACGMVRFVMARFVASLRKLCKR
jgi:hypothetical protein